MAKIENRESTLRGGTNLMEVKRNVYAFELYIVMFVVNVKYYATMMLQIDGRW